MTTARIPAATATDTGRPNFRPDVQGLRAVAVGLVLLYHAGVPFLSGGYVGVDVFFVISGFLISSHLLNSLERDGRVSFAEFFARRARRILPASLTVAVLTAVAALAVYPPLGIERIFRDGVATVLYVPNIWLAIQDTQYLADHSPSPYQHYWSLGVEEQFYLVWPLILLILFLLARRSRVIVTALIAVVGVASLIACIVLTPLDPPSAFFLLPTRAWELLAGALVGAILLRRPVPMPPLAAAAGGWAGVAMILVAATLFDDATAFPGAAATLPVAGTALVIFSGSARQIGGPTATLSVRPLQFIGLISYSLYLVHWPLLVLPQAAAGESNTLPLAARLLWGVVVAVPLAYLLHRFVESPARTTRLLAARRPRVTLWLTLGLTLALAFGIAAAGAWGASRPTPTGGPAPSAPHVPEDPPRATSFLPDNLRPSLEDAADDLPRVYADGCHNDVTTETVQTCRYGSDAARTRIAVFGDSHSAQWFPAVEEYARARGDASIASYTKSSCPAVSVTVLDKNVPYLSCDRWRSAVIEHLVADPPDLVIISSFSGYALDGATAEADRTARWADGLATTVSALEAAGAEVLVIADTPRFPSSPVTCIASQFARVDSCAGSRAAVLDLSLAAAEESSVRRVGGDFVDLTSVICDDVRCPVIVDDLLVYRDVNHLTASYVRYLEPALVPFMDALVTQR